MGRIDYVYLYNRPLTSAEVLQLYTVLPVCPPPITGNTLVCPNSFQTYSVAPISNATYTWSFPGGWTGSSSTNTMALLPEQFRHRTMHQVPVASFQHPP